MDESGSPNEELAGLPEVLRQVALAIDLQTALTLARELGGTDIYLSSEPRPDSQIVNAVGPDAARRIADLFGRGKLHIPLGPVADFSRRSVGRIRRLIGEGKNDQQIAREIGCHARTVMRIRNGDRHRQIDLDELIDQSSPPRSR